MPAPKDESIRCVVCNVGSHRADWVGKSAPACDSHSPAEVAAAVAKKKAAADKAAADKAASDKAIADKVAADAKATAERKKVMTPVAAQTSSTAVANATQGKK